MSHDLPEPLAEEWQPLGTRTAETTVMVTSITAETTLYEPVETTSLESAAGSEIPVRSLFTVEMTFSPPLSAVGVSPSSALSMAAPKAKSQFVDTITDEGVVVDGQRDALEFEGPNGAAGTWYVLDAAYPLEGGETTARLPAEAHVAVWPTEESYGMAGGTVPLEFDRSEWAVDAGLDGDSSDLVDPERDRETVAALIRGLEI
ncbi:hypothetical protein [Natronobacterium texcoconense]|uniref:Uncharacterized protein n=1 Tax=Natronobacterium texcoconense TaxID=1095778 RepID=A0A1H1FLY5_NATTX|nr:hypothetical protein [Natronobacterium texcoconense]SDR01506.1 hypothetical protein SAMN04489842_2007 [Natronobacterium texcoconense]